MISKVGEELVIACTAIGASDTVIVWTKGSGDNLVNITDGFVQAAYVSDTSSVQSTYTIDALELADDNDQYTCYVEGGAISDIMKLDIYGMNTDNLVA